MRERCSHLMVRHTQLALHIQIHLSPHHQQGGLRQLPILLNLQQRQDLMEEIKYCNIFVDNVILSPPAVR